MSTELLITAGGLFLSFITYFLGSKQRRVTTQGSELDSVQKAVSIWRGLAENYGLDMEKWRTLATKFKDDILELHTIVEKQQNENKKLVAEIEVLRTEVTRLGKMLNHAK